MNIAFVCYFEPGRISGPTNSVTSLFNALKRIYGISGDIFTSSNKVEKNFLLNGCNIKTLKSFYSSTVNYDVVILAGIFDVEIFKIAMHCKKINVPYVISPRGNLSRLALNKSLIKKRFALLTYTGLLLKNSFGFHFLTSDEYKYSVKYSGEYFFSSNGTELIKSERVTTNKENIILFIGRLDINHKGLDLLLNSLVLIKEYILENNWKIILCGPDSVNDKRKLLDLILKNDISEIISINEPVTGIEKEKLLARSAIFVHPSRYEGQPQAVIEAMVNGCIPALTVGANMSQSIPSFLKISEFNSHDYSKLLIESIRLAADGENFDTIKNYSNKNFTWDKSATDFYNGLKKLL